MNGFYWTTRCICKGLFLLFYRHRTYGLQHLYNEGALIVPNHTSYLDPPLVAISWPRQVAFLARKTLFKNLFLGTLIRKLNAFPLTGTGADIASLRLIGELIQQGQQVVIFPEGARSSSGQLQEIKSGIAMIATRNQCALIPVYIHGAFAIWPRTHRFPKLWGKTACVFGTPLLYSQFSSLPKKEAQQAIAEEIRKSIDNLRVWYENGAHGIPP